MRLWRAPRCRCVRIVLPTGGRAMADQGLASTLSTIAVTSSSKASWRQKSRIARCRWLMIWLAGPLRLLRTASSMRCSPKNVPSGAVCFQSTVREEDRQIAGLQREARARGKFGIRHDGKRKRCTFQASLHFSCTIEDVGRGVSCTGIRKLPGMRIQSPEN